MNDPALRPRWLRPAVATLVVAVHAAAIVVAVGEAVRPGSGAIEIAVVSEPEPSPEPTPEIVPTDAAQAAAPTEPPPTEPPPEVEAVEPEPQPEPPAEPPPPEPPPEPQPVEPLPPPPEPRPEPPRKPDVVRERRPREPPRRKTPRSSERAEASVAAEARAAARAEAGEARRAAAASYASLVAGEIRRHRHYPAAAREANVTGVVVVAFTIGPTGTVVSHSIVRSSGHAVLDGAVRSMMAAVHLPPPPDGSFRSSIPVRFETH